MTRRTRRGAAMLEATLLLPLFLLFWFGLVDWGISYWVHQSIVHQANLATRWGVCNPYNPDAIKNLVVFAQTTAPDDARPGMFGLRPANVDVQLLGAEATGDRRLLVTVSGYSWTHFTPWFAGSYVGRPVVVSLPAEDLQ